MEGGRYSAADRHHHAHPDHDILGQNAHLGSGNYHSAYADHYKGEGVSQSQQQVTRQQQINKNFVLPEGHFQAESSYTNQYQNKEVRVKTEKVTYHDNEVIPRGKFEGHSNYISSYLRSPG